MMHGSKALAAALACVLLLAGCGGSDGGTDGGAERGTTTAGGLPPAVQEKYDAALEGSFGPPPSEAPRPQAGKNVWFIPLASSIANFREPGSIHDAADRLGWRLTEFDGKYSPDNIVSGIRQAIADGADGIVTYVVDCAVVRSALQDARRAGVKVVGGAALDCDESDPDAEPLYDAMTRYQTVGADRPFAYKDFLREFWGPAQALAVIAGTNGTAKIIDVTESDLVSVVQQDKGLREELAASCPDCEIVETVSFAGGEVGTPLRQRIEQALTAHPEANALTSPYDAISEISAAALRASGRADDVYHVGGEGKAPVMDAIREDDAVQAGVGVSMQWEMWNMVDSLNRLFHGEREPAEGWPSGNGTQIVDREHNLPPTGRPYAPPIDFRSAYLKAWGVD